jgi:hypothetical protein
MNGGAWSSTWSSSTGTPGTDATLSRSISFTSDPGTSQSASYRITFADENGDSKSIASTLHASNLDPVVKTLRVPYSMMIPISDSETWNVASGYLDPGGTSVTRTYEHALVLPKGVEITAFSARLYRGAVADSAVAALWQGSDTTSLSTKLGQADHTSTGWATVSTSASPLPVTVGDEAYTVVVQLFANSAQSARFLYFEATYTMPTYANGY